MSQKLNIEDLKQVLVLGAGTLGLRVGLQAAISGFQVKIYDIDQSQLETAKRTQGKLASKLSLSETYAAIDFGQVADRIQWTTDADFAAANADLVNESVTEDIDIKNKVWKEFGQLCPPHTIFTTNTSFLIPSMFAQLSGRPERFCAFHFHDVFVANVVDIMPHIHTEPWIVELLYEFGKRLNQTPIKVARESAGYVFNHILMHALQAAVNLLANGVSTVQDIDRSWMGNFNMPVGPFGMLDQIGIDTAWRVAKHQNTKEAQVLTNVLQNYMDRQELGVKTGKGFYTYPNPEYQQPNFL